MRKDRSIGLLAVLALSAAGCGDVEATGFLSLSQVSGIEVDEKGCGAPDKTLVPPLVYDVGVGAEYGHDYLLGLWLRNSLPENGDDDASTGRIDTNRVQVERIEVEFTDREMWGFLDKSIDVGMPFVIDTGSEIGWPTALIPFEVARQMIDSDASPIPARLSGEYAPLPIRVKASGKLLDGTEVVSNEFSLTLRVCNFCMLGCGEGFEPVGCSVAQPDLYECQESKEEPAP